MGLTIRRATAADTPAILEISSHIWEGEDYVPLVLDEWLAAERDEVTVALLDETLVAFAHFAWLIPDYAWFEGIRTHPERRGAGAGKAITRYFLEKARRDGARKAGLSTYIENDASIHIIESHGFSRMAAFSIAGYPRDDSVPQIGRFSEAVEAIPHAEALEFIRRSDFLKASRGYLPRGWWFYPFEEAAAEWARNLNYCLGLREGARLRGLLCVGQSTHGPHEFYIDFLEGDPEAMEILLRHAVQLNRESPWTAILIPGREEGPELPVLEMVRALDFRSEENFAPCVFVYERPIAPDESFAP